MAVSPGIAQQYPNWAILHPTCRATILAGHPSRLLPCFETPGLIEDQHRLRIADVLDQRGTQRIPDGLGVPPGTPQHMLHTIRCGIAVDFGQLPAIFALPRAEPAADRGPGAVTSFTAGKVGHETSFHLSQPECPCPHRLQR